MKKHILLVDDEAHLREIYRLTLESEYYQVTEAQDLKTAIEQLKRTTFDCVLTDMSLPDGTGISLLQWLQQFHRSEPSVVITAYGSMENAVKSLKSGAFDYLVKPVDLNQLRHIVAEITRVPNVGEKKKTAALERMIGNSTQMVAVKQMVRRIAHTMAPVMILGETGTGKELVAQSLHELSSRRGAFIAVNCGALSEALLESEFFGYRKGAFTGALHDHDGFFRAAEEGTLFLDEVAELPLTMQAKLLRALQERRVRPVGATTEIAVSVRIICATWQNLDELTQTGEFRKDLFYRLNVIRIDLPPLRERREDIPLIADELLKRISVEMQAPKPAMLSADAVETLCSLEFTGNIRELYNLLQRALAFSESGIISEADLLQSATAPLIMPSPTLQGAGATKQLPDDLEQYLLDIERDILESALKKTKNNRTAAAALLGLNARQMRYRVERLNLKLKDDEPNE